MMDLTSPGTVRELITRHGFSFTKSLGQNFILSRNALERMIAASGIDSETGVLEIGPGIGTLTQAIAEHAGLVAAVEIDRALLPILAETLSDYQNVRVYREDALKLDLPVFCQVALPVSKRVVCANLPYYITTQAVTRLLESKLFLQITLLLQKEAVDRLCAHPGDPAYCAASVIVRYYATPKLLFRVSPDSFMPRPKVASAVLSLTPYERGLSEEQEQLFLKIVQAAFAQRRKTLQNALSASSFCDRERVQAAIRACGFREDIRGEALDVNDFLCLTEAFLQ